MSRLPHLQRQQLDDTGRSLWDLVTRTRGPGIVNQEGVLSGPFNAWLYAPSVGTKLTELGALLRFQTSVDQRLIELAIITVGAHWKSEFEWFAHSRLALECGVRERTVESIQQGRVLETDRNDERIVYAVAHDLVTKGTIDDALFKSAVDLLGPQGTIELIAVCGYYCLVSFTLNSMNVPLPPGVAPRWPDGQ